MAATLQIVRDKGLTLRGSELEQCYEGDIVNGQRHGYGTYTYPNSFIQYSGQFYKGRKHGFGKLVTRDGTCYEGQFENDEIQGQGTKRFPNGKVYTGSFTRGEFHGDGELRLPNGDVYTGAFVANQYEGLGVYAFADGSVYEGHFHAHKFHGQGSLRRPDGQLYSGGWAEGLRSGYGDIQYANGDWYKGHWQEDVYSGQGTLYVKLWNVTYDGEFAKGKPATGPIARKLNASFQVPLAPPDPKAKGGAKAAAPVGPENVVPAQSAAPLPYTITCASVDDCPAGEYASSLPSRAQTAGTDASGTPPPPLFKTVYAVDAKPGREWRTSFMERGRHVNVTLHREPPAAAEDKQSVSMVLAVVKEGEEEVGVRISIFQGVALGPAVPIAREANGETLTGLTLELEGGQAHMEGLVLGTAELPIVGNHIMVFSSWAIPHACLTLAFPEAGAAKKK